MTGPTDSLDERYGRPPGGAHGLRRRAGLAAVGLVVLAFLAWLAWAAWFHSTPELDAGVTRWEPVDDHVVRVQLDTRISDDADGTCLLRATAEDHTVVGERNLTVDELRAAEDEWLEVRTERRATTVQVVRCTRG